MEIFKQPPSISFTSGNLAEQWRRWEQQFRVYYTAAELVKKEAKTRVAILLHCAGPEAQDIHSNFVFSDTDGDRASDYNSVLKKFKEYCEPRKNEVFERYKFWQRDQHEGETIDQWVNDLRILLGSCEYGDQKEKNLRDRIVFGVADTRVKERLLRESDLTLTKALDICHAAEASKVQLKTMSGEAKKGHDVHAIGKGKQKSRGKPSNFQQHSSNYKQQQKGDAQGRSQQSQKDCQYCGKTHPPRKCPAYGASCNKCGRSNHFASVCQDGKFGGFRKKVHVLDQSEQDQFESGDDESDYLFVGALYVGAVSEQKRDSEANKWYETILIGGQQIRCKLDTGAEANVLPARIVSKMQNAKLAKTMTVLNAFGDSQIFPKGTVTLESSGHTGDSCTLKYYVTDKADSPILGYKACEQLKLVKRVNIRTCIPKQSALTKQHIEQEYADVFKGVGQYEKEYHMQLNEKVEGVIQQPRRIPYATQPKLKKTLDALKEQNIVADVDKPTEWVSNIVIVEKKNGSLRLCLDPKPLNEAIKRERHNIPTPADVQSQLSGKTIFTVVDMKDGYWHVKLSDESSYYCTFNTPWGRKRFLRMPFGISSASEVMQKRNEETFGDISGVHVIADDLIIAAATEQEHDAILRKVLDRARDKGVRFNYDKIQFKVSEVEYMGNLVSSKGLKPDPKKVEAIVDMPTPTDVPSL